MAEKGPDPEALERQIVRTREELARTVDRIADRVSPKRIVQRGVGRVTGGVRRFVDDARANARYFSENLARDRDDGEGGPPPPPPKVGPVLIGAGALLVVGAAVVIVRRRRRRRRR